MRTAIPLVLVAASLSAQQIVAGPTLGPYAQQAGDVDGDGRDDYVVLIFSTTTLEVHSGRTRTALPHLTRPWVGNYQALHGDVDGDGCDDLSVGGNLVVSGRTGATLLALLPVDLLWCAGDLDADGFDDLFLKIGRVGSADADLVLRSSRTGAVLLTLFVPFQMYTGQTWSRAYDVNGDGYDDFLDVRIDNYTYNHQASVRGGPTLAPLGVYHTGSMLSHAGDTDGDGVRELGRNDEILHGTTLATIWVMPPGVRSMNLSTGGEPFDIDGDGFDDAWGDAPGAWSGRTHAALPGAPAVSFVPLGDIDGDGRTEFASSGVLYEWQDPALPRCSRAVRRGAAGATSSGSRPRITVRGSCALGRTLFLDLRGGTPNGVAFLAWGGASDLDLAGIGAPGNRAYIAPIDSIFLPGDAHGLVRHHFDVPVSPGLIGQGLSLQFGVFDAAANALGVVTSNAVDLEIHN